jgi:hypothetical protein
MALKVYTFFVLALITGMTGLAGDAFAQEITIETSADDHDNNFFGEGVLRVVVTDPDADDDDTIEVLFVEIHADPDVAGSTSEDIAVPETNDGSGRFEFFLVHVNATAVGPDELNALNSAGVEGDGTCLTDCAPFVTFGPGGDIDIDTDLYEEVRFEISADNTEVVVDYEETAGTLTLDRDSYGTTSFVYVSVNDQDANLNPFENDEFVVDPETDPNADLFVFQGGTFEEAVVFRETGDNTAVFEGRYRLGASMIADSESLALTLLEKANYSANLTAFENDSNNADEISFTIGNADGTMNIEDGQQEPVTWDPTLILDKDSYTVGEIVHATITDQDANRNSDASDSIQVQISSGSDRVDVSAFETGADTGVFEAIFHFAAETDEQSGRIKPGGSATITYIDERPADYFEKIQAGKNPQKEFSVELDIQLPVMTGVKATGITPPVARDASGGSGPYEIGDSVTLSVTISNNNDNLQPFVALLEVRDSKGVTVFLALQSGTLESSGSTDIGVLWQPDQAGAFEVRTFVVTGLDLGREVLSQIASSDIIVT